MITLDEIKREIAILQAKGIDIKEAEELVLDTLEIEDVIKYNYAKIIDINN